LEVKAVDLQKFYLVEIKKKKSQAQKKNKNHQLQKGRSWEK
jgi:hypothetical protein